MERSLHASLEAMVNRAAALLPDGVRRPGLAGELLAFLQDRVAYFLRERGIPYDVVEAVLAAGADDPVDALARAEALQAVRGGQDLERLVIGFKRAANILKGMDEAALPDPAAVPWAQAHPTERELHAAVRRVGRELEAAERGKDYPAMLKLLLELRAPIDRFFDEVLVMSEDPQERDRRLALLAEARSVFHHVFDPSCIVLEGEAAAPDG